MYCALTVDLKDSRKYPTESRNELQHYLISAAEALNQIFRPTLERELSFSGGDELQGLFIGPDAAFLCLRMLRRLLFPIPLHAGMGVGEWTTVIPERNTFYQDGPAFHRARAAIEQAKRETDYTALISLGSADSAGMNAMLNAVFALTEQNTAYQNELALLLECFYPILSEEGLYLTELNSIPALMRRRKGLAAFFDEKERKRPNTVFDKVEREPDFRLRNAKQTWSEAWRENRPVQRESYPFAHPRGAASAIAEAAGLTRQAVDTALRASNVYAERALTLALLEMLKAYH